MDRLRILTWNVQPKYLFSLCQTGHDFYLPVKPGRQNGHAGLTEDHSWPDNVQEVPADQARRLELDCILFQSPQNYLLDRNEILSPSQRRLPRIYLEHDPPATDPTNSTHLIDDPNTLVVQVTCYNNLMWNCRRTPTRVIEHGVVVPVGGRYTGEIPRGITAVDDLHAKGRLYGADLFESVRQQVPLDLIGRDAESLGGIGKVESSRLAAFLGRYRFFFSPVRYSSLDLAVCEAMMIGLPIVAFATTEMATIVENGVSGYLDTDVDRLIERMKELVADPGLAHRLGEGARRCAWERFGIARFVKDWNDAFEHVLSRSAASAWPPLLALQPEGSLPVRNGTQVREKRIAEPAMFRERARIGPLHAKWCR
jgi:hypothetical protein